MRKLMPIIKTTSPLLNKSASEINYADCTRASVEKFPGGATEKRPNNSKKTENSTIKPLSTIYVSLPAPMLTTLKSKRDNLVVLYRYTYGTTLFSLLNFLMVEKKENKQFVPCICK